jgi:hypothetical protein
MRQATKLVESDHGCFVGQLQVENSSYMGRMHQLDLLVCFGVWETACPLCVSYRPGRVSQMLGKDDLVLELDVRDL